MKNLLKVTMVFVSMMLPVSAFAASAEPASSGSSFATGRNLKNRYSIGINAVKPRAQVTPGWLIEGEFYTRFFGAWLSFGPKGIFGDISPGTSIFGVMLALEVDVPVAGPMSLLVSAGAGGFMKFMGSSGGERDEPWKAAMQQVSAALDFAVTRDFHVATAASYMFVPKIPRLSSPVVGIRLSECF
ncbi:MAG: hypothetical protein A2583_06040 [Bdellovibrionales bacterium RIFOXYD1_FULL_53_11]|nr:MAG: hypothetical protein A2583_06040 [Bdellovibrionales bacterium RIFOXYD1_FULL_53_11]